MGQLIEMSNGITMGTREIAEMLNKNHSDIKRSADRLYSSGVLTQPLAELTFEHRGNSYTEYRLNKRDSIILVAQNSPEFTARLVDRWQELEEGAAVPRQLSHVEQIKGLMAAGLLTVAEAETAVLRSVGMRQLPAVKPVVATRKQPRTNVVNHGMTFEQAVAEFVSTLSNAGKMATEDAYLLFCEMYGTNMAGRNKFVSAVRQSGVEKSSFRFDGISRQGFIFH